MAGTDAARMTKVLQIPVTLEQFQAFELYAARKRKPKAEVGRELFAPHWPQILAASQSSDDHEPG